MDSTQFHSLAEGYRDMIYRIALNYHRNIEDAEDTMQDVLLKLYLRSEPFESEQHLKHWLIKVTLNRCRSIKRSIWRRAVPLEGLDIPVDFSSPEDGELFCAVMSLPEKHRTALYLFYYEELNIREISDLLGISESAVTSRLSRARKELKRVWTEGMKNGI